MRRLLWTSALALLLVAQGCAASLAASRTAKVLDHGQWEVVTGPGLMLPAGAMVTAVKEGRDAFEEVRATSAESGRVQVPEDVARRALVGAALMVLQPPSAVSETTVRYGVLPGFDVGLRWSGPALRGDAWGQLLDGEWKVAAGLGLGRHAFGGSVLGLLGKFDLAEFSRSDLDVTILAGREWRLGAIYFGPKAMFSRLSGSGLLVDGDRLAATRPDGETIAELDLSLGNSFIYGGLVGARVGWKYLFLTAELGLFGSRFSPRIAGETFDLGGLIVYPSIGLVATL